MRKQIASLMTMLVAVSLLVPFTTQAQQNNQTARRPEISREKIDLSDLERAAPEGAEGSRELPAALRGQDPNKTVSVMVELVDEPVVVAWNKARASRSPDSANLTAKAQAQTIQAAQAQLMPLLQQRGARVMYSTQRVLNGIAVRTTIKQLAELRSLPGVKSVTVMTPKTRNNVSSVPLIGAPEIWSGNTDIGVDARGEGIKIGIIDTGIDYLHTNFGGPGTEAAYESNNTTIITDNVGFPNAKVVGGYDFAGDEYNASDDENDVPKPDPDPMDCNGHGTHVAGTAAGFGVNEDGTTYNGPYTAEAARQFTETLRIGPGVAPLAQLYALRVFGCDGSTNLTEQALEWSVDPNGDFDFSDRLDVVNMSLGAPFGSENDTSAIATNNAGLAGVLVAASAGNEGDTYYVTGAPGAATWAVSTASSVDALEIYDGMVVTSTGQMEDGIYPTSNGVLYDWSQGGVTGRVVYPPTQRSGCEVFTAENTQIISGNIVLLDWTDQGSPGYCGSVARGRNATNAGAIGIILVYNHPGAIGVSISGSPLVPSTITTYEVGQQIKADLAAGETVTAELTDRYNSSIKVFVPGQVDTLSMFTSRGPRRGDTALKPDISAPGQTTASALTGTGDEIWVISGTSMAAPHIAGSLALLRQIHPTWSVEHIKALIMNTAEVETRTGGATGPRYSPSRQGAGRVSLDDAGSAEVVAFNADNPGQVSISFGAPEVVGSASYVKNVRVVNHGSNGAVYNVTIDPVVESAGVTVEVSDDVVTVPANGVATFSVMVTVDAAALDRTIDDATATRQGDLPRHFLNEHSGYIRLDYQQPANAPAGHTTNLKVPFYIAPRPASDLHADGPLVFDAGDTNDTLTLQGQGVDNDSYSSLSWVLELQETSVNDAQTSGSANAADIKAIGVGSDVSATGTLTDDTYIFFGIAGYAPHNTPNDTDFYIYIDTNRDGTDDFVVFNWNYGSATGGDASDVFISVVEDLETEEIVGVEFLNLASAQIETAAFNSSVMVLPVPAGALGLTAGNSRFNYQVISFHRDMEDVADISNVHTFDPGAPALDAGAGDIPLYYTGPGTDISVELNMGSYLTNQSKGLLLLHHFNTEPNKAEIVPVQVTVQNQIHMPIVRR